jgi:hypothetical protein
MKRLLLALGCCALLASCGSRAGQPGTAGTPNPALDATLAKQLPGLGQLDPLRGTSAITFSGLTMVSSFQASVDGGGNLILNAPAGQYAWAVFDLGVQPSDFTIGTVNFPHAPDWTALSPAPKVFVGVSVYSLDRWVFRQRGVNGSAADFNSLPPGSTFLSATNHSYVAILADAANLSFGDQLDLTGTAGPGGELPAKYTVVFSGLPAKTGQNNQLIVKSDNSGGDIVTYCATDNGGARVHFDYDSGTDAITTSVKTLFDAGEALQGCYSYRLDYYADGRLAMGAAKGAPNSIRHIHELTAGSNTFSIETAADNTVLPADFTNPQFDYKLSSNEDPQVLFMADTGKLGYAYYVAGSWGIDTGGPDILGNIALRLSGPDAIVAYQAAAGADKKVVIRKLQQRPAGNDFGTANDIFAVLGKDTGDGISMLLGPNDSIHVAQYMGDGTDSQVGFAYSSDGVIGGTWGTATVDDLGGTGNVGQYPSVGVLRDGTPVIAYYDITNASLRFAVSTVPDGGNETGATWTSYRIDTSRFGNQVGLNPALGVIQRSGADPDKVIVAYGVADGADNVLRVILFDAPAH